MQRDGEKVETVTDLTFLGSKSTTNDHCSHEIKRWLLLGRKALTNLDSVLKGKDIILPKKYLYCQSYDFSSSHVQLWELDDKEAWKKKKKWSPSVVSDSLRPHGLQPTRVLHPWDPPGKNTGVGCRFLLHEPRRIDAFKVWRCGRLLRVPGAARRTN